MTIHWCKAIPEEVRAAAEPILTKWVGLAPVWVQSLLVRWADTNEFKCRMTTREDQRDAIMDIGQDWITWPHDREQAILHELCHLYNGPLSHAGRESVKLIIGNDYPTPGSRIAELMISETCERVNMDLVALLMRLAPNGIP